MSDWLMKHIEEGKGLPQLENNFSSYDGICVSCFSKKEERKAIEELKLKHEQLKQLYQE